MKYCDNCHTTYPTEFTTCPKDQGVLRPVSELQQGMVLRGKYQVLEKVGAGGMAAVYRVRHLHLQEDVAIKVVSSRLAEDQEFVDRFKTEAVITRKLRHPNAVRLDDFDTTEDGRPFIVMEYVRGQSLREVLHKEGWLPAARAAGIAGQAALALGAAHELGIVHRDIKPENILLVPQQDGSDLVKVLDFGIAKVRKDSFELGAGYKATQTGLVLGTPQYLSPEQARGKHGGSEVDGRADLYALGIVLYEMLTGQLPFHADTPFDLLLHHIQTPPTPPHLANPAVSISPAMSELVVKTLEKDPSRRFQSGKELAAALANPEVLVQAAASAHAFSTAALAAAAAGSLAEAAAPGQAPAQVASPATAAVLPTTAPLQTVAATVPMASPEPYDGTSVSSRAPAVPVAAASPPQKGRRMRKWILVASGAAVTVVLLWALASRNPGQPAPDTNNVATTPVVESRATATPRSARPVRRAPAYEPRSEAPARRSVDGAQHARAQQLVAVGYRRMEGRNFGGAREAFAQALEIEPDNAAAQRGLSAAQTGQTVQGIAGVFRR